MMSETDSETTVDELGELADELEQKDTEFGTLADGERFQITVKYETDAGNTRSRSGEVWAVDSDIGVGSETRIRFSEDAGEVDEDPYYIKLKNGDAVVVSVSENATHTELGPVSAFTTEGKNSEDPEDDDPELMTDGGEPEGEPRSSPSDEREAIREELDGEDIHVLTYHGGQPSLALVQREKRPSTEFTLDSETVIILDWVDGEDYAISVAEGDGSTWEMTDEVVETHDTREDAIQAAKGLFSGGA